MQDKLRKKKFIYLCTFLNADVIFDKFLYLFTCKSKKYDDNRVYA